MGVFRPVKLRLAANGSGIQEVRYTKEDIFGRMYEEIDLGEDGVRFREVTDQAEKDAITAAGQQQLLPNIPTRPIEWSAWRDPITSCGATPTSSPCPIFYPDRLPVTIPKQYATAPVGQVVGGACGYHQPKNPYRDEFLVLHTRQPKGPGTALLGDITDPGNLKTPLVWNWTNFEVAIFLGEAWIYLLIPVPLFNPFSFFYVDSPIQQQKDIIKHFFGTGWGELKQYGYPHKDDQWHEFESDKVKQLLQPRPELAQLSPDMYETVADLIGRGMGWHRFGAGMMARTINQFLANAAWNGWNQEETWRAWQAYNVPYKGIRIQYADPNYKLPLPFSDDPTPGWQGVWPPTSWQSRYSDCGLKRGDPCPPKPKKWKCVSGTCVEDPYIGADTKAACEVECPPLPKKHYMCLPTGGCIENSLGAWTDLAACVAACTATTRYSCVSGTCVPNPVGPYTTLFDCAANCHPGTKKYGCVNGVCSETVNGPYDSLAACQAAGCSTAKPKWSCRANFSGCYQDINGIYLTQAACLAACKPQANNYKCINKKCTQDPTGPFRSLTECRASGCEPPPKWDCDPVEHVCVQVATGRYATKAACQAAGCSQPVKWGCVAPGECARVAGGLFDTEVACLAACTPQAFRFECISGNCVPSISGPYLGFAACLIAGCETTKKCPDKCIGEIRKIEKKIPKLVKVYLKAKIDICDFVKKHKKRILECWETDEFPDDEYTVKYPGFYLNENEWMKEVIAHYTRPAMPTALWNPVYDKGAPGDRPYAAGATARRTINHTGQYLLWLMDKTRPKPPDFLTIQWNEAEARPRRAAEPDDIVYLPVVDGRDPDLGCQQGVWTDALQKCR